MVCLSSASAPSLGLFGLLSVTLLPIPASARTWTITPDGSGDAPTIQAGIDSASHGDVVLVGPGTYYENINLSGKAIHLRSTLGPESTAIDGSQGDSSVVVCNSREGNDTIIEGFTITNGKGTLWVGNDRRGGGILCENGSPTIRGNHIVRNQAVSPRPGSSRGGGILFSSFPDVPPIVLENNLIAENFSSSLGGGIEAESACTIRGNVIRDNSTGAGDGGGILLSRAKSLVVGNLFLGNVAADHGGGIYVTNSGPASVPPSDIIISGNLFIANEALGLDGFGDCSGGAIWVRMGASIVQNTVAFNHAESRGAPAGGGVCIVDPPQGMVIERNIIFRNGEGGLVMWQVASGTWGTSVRRCLIYDNGYHDIFNYAPSAITLELEENVFEDPMFCILGAESRGQLAGISPALNQPYGVIGAISEPGCPPYGSVNVQRTTWGAIKARYAPRSFLELEGEGKN